MYTIRYLYRGHILYLKEWNTTNQRIQRRRFNVYTEALKAAWRFAMRQEAAGHPVECFLVVGTSCHNIKELLCLYQNTCD
jgi:hypothetical protein